MSRSSKRNLQKFLNQNDPEQEAIQSYLLILLMITCSKGPEIQKYIYTILVYLTNQSFTKQDPDRSDVIGRPNTRINTKIHDTSSEPLCYHFLASSSACLSCCQRRKRWYLFSYKSKTCKESKNERTNKRTLSLNKACRFLHLQLHL